MDYFCIDLETSGPTPGLHNLLSIGAAHVRRFRGEYQAFGDIYLEVKPVFAGFEPAAMAVNRLDPQRLEKEGLSPAKAMTQLVEWVEDQRTGKRDRPVFVAHNAPFDWMFFAYHCGHAGLVNPFGHSALDTKALAMGRLKLSWNETTMKNVAEKVGVGSMDLDLLHHAGHDARHLAKVFSALMNLEPETKAATE